MLFGSIDCVFLLWALKALRSLYVAQTPSINAPSLSPRRRRTKLRSTGSMRCVSRLRFTFKPFCEQRGGTPRPPPSCLALPHLHHGTSVVGSSPRVSLHRHSTQKERNPPASKIWSTQAHGIVPFDWQTADPIMHKINLKSKPAET